MRDLGQFPMGSVVEYWVWRLSSCTMNAIPRRRSKWVDVSSQPLWSDVSAEGETVWPTLERSPM
jgi:hypothetical protein